MISRRIIILFVITCFFTIGVLVWYFFFSKPKEATSLATPNNILDSIPAPRFQFITNFFTKNTDESTSTTEVTSGVDVPFLQIWDKPATGKIFVSISVLREVTSTSTQGTTTITSTKTIRTNEVVLLFVDRSTGYVYGYNTEDGSTYQISNTTIPGVYDAYIFDSGKEIIIRRLSDDGTTILSSLAFISSLSNNGSPEALEKLTNLPNNISSLSISESQGKVSFIIPNTVGSSLYTATSKGQSFITSSPFSDWSLSYGGEQLYATSKASAYVTGETVSIPSFSRVTGGRTGLVVTPSSDYFLASMWSSGGLLTFITSAKGNIEILPAKTIASKCSTYYDFYFICGIPNSLPSPEEGLPDDWYQGRVLFSDQLSLIDASTGSVLPLYSFDSRFGDMDVTHLSSSRDSSFVSFIRKQDSTLWLLQVKKIPTD